MAPAGLHPAPFGELGLAQGWSSCSAEAQLSSPFLQKKQSLPVLSGAVPLILKVAIVFSVSISTTTAVAATAITTTMHLAGSRAWRGLPSSR